MNTIKHEFSNFWLSEDPDRINRVREWCLIAKKHDFFQLLWLSFYCFSKSVSNFSAGKLCVAPAFDSWYRAVTIEYYQDEDEVLVKYVDYGGYSRLPRSDLRQIRFVVLYIS